MKNEKQYLSNLLKQMQHPVQEDQQQLQFQKQLLKGGLLGIIAVICLIWAGQASWVIAPISIVVGILLMLAGSIKNTLNNNQILRQHLDIKTIEQRLLEIQQETKKKAQNKPTH